MNACTLIPILTEKECEEDFISKINSQKLVLVFVVDEKTKNNVPAALARLKIKSAENVIEKIRQRLPSSVVIKEYVEWGSWPEKVQNIARLEESDLVLMRNSESSEAIRLFLKAAGIPCEIHD
jgi:hypothetical protein